MSNAGQAVLTIGGTILGFAIGQPQLGFVLGSLAGSALFPTQLPSLTGPQLTDHNTTNVEVGGPVAEVLGTAAVAPTVIWLGPVETVSTTEEVGGKGAPEQDVTTFSYFQPIALGLCRAPPGGSISGILRIWENGKLVYDVRSQQAGESDADFANRSAASDLYADGFTFYGGGETQEPDPTIESVEGVGNVPAFRELCYLVFHRRQLRDDQAQRHPNFLVEVSDSSDVNEEIVLVVANSETASNTRYTTDGETWTTLTVPRVLGATGCAYSPPQDRIIICSRTNYIWISDNRGASWTEVQPGQGNDAYQDIEWAGPLGLWVLCGSNSGGSEGRIYTSPTGNAGTWTQQTLPSGVNNCYSMHFAAALGLLLSKVVGGTQNVILSSNAVDWARCTDDDGMFSGASGSIVSNDSYVFANEANSIGTVFRSPDGLTFDARTFSVSQGLPKYTVACSDERVIARTPSTNQVAISTDNGGTWSTPSVTWPIANSRGSLLFYSTLLDAFFWICDAAATTPGAVLRTTNGGTAWEHVASLGTLTWSKGIAVTKSATIRDVSIADCIRRFAQRAGYDLGTIDVSELESRRIPGMALQRLMTARDAIQTLVPVGYFDVVESGSVIKFPVRGRAIVATIQTEDLGAHETGSGAPVAIDSAEADDIELPRQLRLHYIAPSRDYEQGEQLSIQRISAQADQITDVSVAVCLEDTDALRIADVLAMDAWAGRWSHEIALDRSYLWLEPADVVAVPIRNRTERVRVVKVADSSGLLRKMRVVTDDDGSYVSERIAQDPARTPPVIAYYQNTSAILLDLPALRDADDDAGFYAALYPSGAGNAWIGGALWRSLDGAGGWTAVGSVSTTATVGEIVSSDTPGSVTTWDEAAEIVVDIAAGTLSSATEDQVIAGANVAAIGAHGRWQIVQFRDVELVSGTQYRLTGLLWGRQGTEHVAGTTEVGDQFVLVSGSGILRVPQEVAGIGQTRHYRSVSAGQSFAVGQNQTFAGAGRALLPYSPVHLEADYVDGDWVITWIRRGRLGRTLMSGTDIPLSEETEAYEVDIFAPGSPTIVVRTLTATDETVTYTAAQQATDMGSPTPLNFAFNVYQLSATVGRGIAGEGMT